MTKRVWICASLIFAFAASALSAQSLLDNQFYRKAQVLLAQSESAMKTGDYDQAAQLAAQAKDLFAQSDGYVAEMTLYYRANSLIHQADDRIAYAKSIQADQSFTDKYNLAVSETGEAKAAFGQKEYELSMGHSKAALSALAGIAPAAASASATLPEYYVVRLIPDRRDCFWRISEYPFIYGDPWKWRILYNENKALLEDAANPDLVEVGIRLHIPSLNGETRSGEYHPSVDY